MANEDKKAILDELRNVATQVHMGIYKIRELRDRFDAHGGEPAFKGAGKLFNADGTPTVGTLPWDDFYGSFAGLGASEAQAAFLAWVAVLARARG